MRTRSHLRVASVVAAAALLLAACGGDGNGGQTSTTPVTPTPTGSPDARVDGGGDGDGTPVDAELSGELVVFAAASLTDVFTELGEHFESTHPGVSIVFNFAGSSTLATQIVEGAPADIFASANDTQMTVVTDADLAEGPVTFTANVLEIVVEAGNPLGITTLEDLARDDVILVLAAPEVPAGALATRMLDEQSIEVTPASLEVDVRATLAKVELGEADVAIVYRSDVATADDTVEGVVIPADRNLSTTYPIVALRDAPNPDAAAAFLELILSEVGVRALEAAGFSAP